jgi:hypothetical protein
MHVVIYLQTQAPFLQEIFPGQEPWAEPELVFSGGKDVLSGANIFIKWGQINI